MTSRFVDPGSRNFAPISCMTTNMADGKALFISFSKNWFRREYSCTNITQKMAWNRAVLCLKRRGRSRFISGPVTRCQTKSFWIDGFVPVEKKHPVDQTSKSWLLRFFWPSVNFDQDSRSSISAETRWPVSCPAVSILQRICTCTVSRWPWWPWRVFGAIFGFDRSISLSVLVEAVAHLIGWGSKQKAKSTKNKTAFLKSKKKKKKKKTPWTEQLPRAFRPPPPTLPSVTWPVNISSRKCTSGCNYGSPLLCSRSKIPHFCCQSKRHAFLGDPPPWSPVGCHQIMAVGWTTLWFPECGRIVSVNTLEAELHWPNICLCN